MARKLRAEAECVDYARRTAVVEPTFGQMKLRQAAEQQGPAGRLLCGLAVDPADAGSPLRRGSAS